MIEVVENLFWALFYENFEKKLKKMSVLTSFCSGKCACGATFLAIFNRAGVLISLIFATYFAKIFKNIYATCVNVHVHTIFH